MVGLFESSVVWCFIYIFIPLFSFIFCMFPVCLMPMLELVQGFRYFSICCVCDVEKEGGGGHDASFVLFQFILLYSWEKN